MTGLPLRKAYEACPLCEGARFTFVRTASIASHPLYRPSLPATITWVSCDDCGHVFTADHWTDEGLTELAQATNANQMPGANLEQHRFLSARIVARAIAAMPAPYPFGTLDLGCWLDVGFGNGSLLLTAQEFGFAPVGLDVRPDTVAAMQALGVEAHHLIIEDLPLPQEYRFKAISLCDVLEHMPYPRRALKAARQLIAEDGALFVSCPNMDTAPWRAWDRSDTNPYWSEIEHAHCFTRKRLMPLLVEEGFVTARYDVSERYKSGMELTCVAS